MLPTGGADVHTARVTTIGDEAVDRFELTDGSGCKLRPAMEAAVREALASGASPDAAAGGGMGTDRSAGMSSQPTGWPTPTWPCPCPRRRPRPADAPLASASRTAASMPGSSLQPLPSVSSKRSTASPPMVVTRAVCTSAPPLGSIPRPSRSLSPRRAHRPDRRHELADSGDDEEEPGDAQHPGVGELADAGVDADLEDDNTDQEAPSAVDANGVVSYNLRAIRERRRWTEEKVAERLGELTGHKLPQASISAMERGFDGERRRRFDAHKLYLLGRVFDVPIVYLFHAAAKGSGSRAGPGRHRPPRVGPLRRHPGPLRPTPGPPRAPGPR